MASLKPIEKNPSDPPVLAIFPGGIPTTLEKDSEFEFQIYQNTEQRKTKQALIYGETDTSHFVGTNISNDTSFRPTHNFAIGVFNPLKRSLKVTSANLCFTVQERNNNELKPVDETVTQADYSEASAQLTERFGSIKRRKELKLQAANKVDIDASEASAFAASAAMESVSAIAETKSSKLSDEHPLLPAFNSLASSPEDIYPFSGMVSDEMWKHIPIKPLLEASSDKEELSQLFPAYVVSRIEKLKTLEASEKEEFARRLMYFTYLMLLYRVKSSAEIRSYLGCTREMADFLAEHFGMAAYDRPSKDGSNSVRIKIKIYLCILALTTSAGCALNAADLAAVCQDLRTTTSELTPFFKAVGCTIAKKDRCALTTPLRLPKLGEGFSRAK